jgi:hypothetical protein
MSLPSLQCSPGCPIVPDLALQWGKCRIVPPTRQFHTLLAISGDTPTPSNWYVRNGNTLRYKPCISETNKRQVHCGITAMCSDPVDDCSHETLETQLDTIVGLGILGDTGKPVHPCAVCFEAQVVNDDLYLCDECFNLSDNEPGHPLSLVCGNCIDAITVPVKGGRATLEEVFRYVWPLEGTEMNDDLLEIGLATNCMCRFRSQTVYNIVDLLDGQY